MRRSAEKEYSIYEVSRRSARFQVRVTVLTGGRRPPRHFRSLSGVV